MVSVAWWACWGVVAAAPVTASVKHKIRIGVSHFAAVAQHSRRPFDDAGQLSHRDLVGGGCKLAHSHSASMSCGCGVR